jgi:hypothetical protein
MADRVWTYTLLTEKEIENIVEILTKENIPLERIVHLMKTGDYWNCVYGEYEV